MAADNLQRALKNDYQEREFLANIQSEVLENFSENKQLYSFQQDALKSAIKALWQFYEEHNGKKEKWFHRFYEGNRIEYENYKPNKESLKHFREYPKDFPIDYSSGKSIISFEHFCNRMSFWMATGSGKTLIIIKLIEILSELMKQRQDMAGREFLFLAHKEELINQFKALVEEFNYYYYSSVKINLVELIDFNKALHTRSSFLPNEITVFYYRSDLIADERKKTTLNFRDYDNDGKWFVLLDEAHKGARDASKRQGYYSILARNGFLFNFSATFVEKNDEATCAFNFNLAKFVEDGYGKQVYVSDKNLEGFDAYENEFKDSQKQLTILKALILHTYIGKQSALIEKAGGTEYHKPLLMSLVNSVNPTSSKQLEEGKNQAPDLQLLFIEIQKIAQKKPKLFDEARAELYDELKDAKYFFANQDNESSKIKINNKLLRNISYADLLKYVFNATKSGKIEVKRIPNNKQELVFKLQSADKPFALIKIGDIAKWLSKILSQDINKTRAHDNSSEFQQLNNKDSSINLLLGSRSFYEGWDSNRPNVILFINIGVGADAKKFVLQSIGRGIRIEPIKEQRKRLERLYRNQLVSNELHNKIKNYVHAPETLFIFGSKAKSLADIIKHMKAEVSANENYVELGGDDLFSPMPKHEKDTDKVGISDLDDEVVRDDLLIPNFVDTDKLIIEDDKNKVRYPISRGDLRDVAALMEVISDEAIALKYGHLSCFRGSNIFTAPKIINAVRDTFKKNGEYYNTDNSIRTLGKPIVSLGKILEYFNKQIKELDEKEEFVRLSNEISHYMKIAFQGRNSDLRKLRNKIRLMRDNKGSYTEDDLKKALKNEEIDIDEYIRRRDVLKDSEDIGELLRDIDIKYLANHYYNPAIISNDEKQDHLTHIIKIRSEVSFLRDLEKTGKELLDKNFDWWRFSKIVENVDKIYIPHYKDGIESKYYPDFVFWLKKGKHYSIFFVDPKGTKHTDYEYKADWANKYFGKPGKEQIFPGYGKEIKVYLRFFKNASEIIPDGYKKYWIDSFKEMSKIASRENGKKKD